MKTKTLIITGAIAILICVAGFVLTNKDSEKVEIPVKQEPLFPKLVDKANDIARIEVNDGKTSMTLVRLENHWGLASKNNYPVKFDTVRSAIMDIANMEKVDKKTSNPELYSRIDVEEPTKDSSNAKKVTFLDKNGQVVESVIVGKSEYSSEPEQYVRKADDKQSWLVKGRSNIMMGDTSWLETDIMDINSARPKSVKIVHTDGDEVIAARELPTDAAFTIENKPEGRELKNEYISREFSRMLSAVRLSDVTPRKNIKLDESEKVATTLMTTFDGLQVTIDEYKKDGKDYALFRAGVDKDQIEQENSRRKEEAAAAAKTSEAASKKDDSETKEESGEENKEGADETKPVETPEPELVKVDDIQKEADTINQKLGDWAYVIPQYVADRIARKMEYFLEEPKTDEDEADASKAGNPVDAVSGLLPKMTDSMMVAAADSDEDTSGGLTLSTETPAAIKPGEGTN